MLGTETCHPRTKNSLSEAVEMAQKLRELAALSEDPHLTPSTHIGWVTTICNFSSKESDLSPGLLELTRTHIYIIKQK